jgi:FMN phosphatase YigB (HAD superfamily)
MASIKVVIFDLDDTLVKPGLMSDIEIKARDIVERTRELGYKVVLVTLNPFGQLVLMWNNILHLFDKVVKVSFDELEGATKRTLFKTNMYREVLREYNVKPIEVLVFDDCILQVAIARQMGMRCVHIKPRSLITWADFHEGVRNLKYRKRRFSV